MSFLKRLVNNLNIPLIRFYIHETIIFPTNFKYLNISACINVTNSINFEKLSINLLSVI